MKAYLVVMLAQSEIGECWVLVIDRRIRNRANYNVCPLIFHDVDKRSTKTSEFPSRPVSTNRNKKMVQFLRTETRKWFKELKEVPTSWLFYRSIKFFWGGGIQGVQVHTHTQVGVYRYRIPCHTYIMHTWHTCVYTYMYLCTYIYHAYIHDTYIHMYMRVHVHMCGTHSWHSHRILRS